MWYISNMPTLQIPRTMSTQHPDNAVVPAFARGDILYGEDEIREAEYAFAQLGCEEQMWDCEGKEVDNFVVKKLLSHYGDFFRVKKLGDSARITLRIPNPEIERAEAKIVLETLESIPRSADVAKLFYGKDATPIFEVILPMTTSAAAVDRVFRYYRDFVAGKESRALDGNGMTVGQWIGEFLPKQINVIPLLEDWDHLLRAGEIVREYIADKTAQVQRVFFGRSDTAMNYGLVSAVLLVKLAAQQMRALEKESGVALPIILGVGSAPFRGNCVPPRVERVLAEYPFVATYTIQSAFKYDYPLSEVQAAIAKIHAAAVREPVDFDTARALEIMQRYTAAYQQQIKALAPAINAVAEYIPRRRMRKLHIGLFGYSRNMAGVTLPRAINFTGALYSLGLPPELLGLDALRPEDVDFLRSAYPGFLADVEDALRYFSPESPFVSQQVVAAVNALGLRVQPSSGYGAHVAAVTQALQRGGLDDVRQDILTMALQRKFLG